MKIPKLNKRPFGQPLARYLCSILLVNGEVYKREEIVNILWKWLKDNHLPSQNITLEKVQVVVKSIVKDKKVYDTRYFEKDKTYESDRGYHKYIGPSRDSSDQTQREKTNNDTSTDNEKSEQTYGDGQYKVCAWCLPLYRKHPNPNGCYRIKIGYAESEGVIERLGSDTKANLPEIPDYLLCFRSEKKDEARILEKTLHNTLEMRQKKIKDNFGTEWFQTNPEEIIEIYEFVYKK